MFIFAPLATTCLALIPSFVSSQDSDPLKAAQLPISAATTLTTCPLDAPISCSSSDTSDLDTCCTNSPGGFILQTQFFDTNPSSGPVDSWTVHGLWPDLCSGSYDSQCDTSRSYTNITDILSAAGASDLLSYMDTYWTDINGDNENFWEHEWAKHGTCISTLEPSCFRDYIPQQEVVTFFNATVELFQTLPTYEWLESAGIVPSTSKTYTLAQLQMVATSKFGQEIIWGCENGVLNQAWYGFHTQGPIGTGTFIPASPDGDKSTCPTKGIKYHPKSASRESSSREEL